MAGVHDVLDHDDVLAFDRVANVHDQPHRPAVDALLVAVRRDRDELDPMRDGQCPGEVRQEHE